MQNSPYILKFGKDTFNLFDFDLKFELYAQFYLNLFYL